MSGDRDDREDAESQAAFKVIDRRRFAADGSERVAGDAPSEKEPEPAAERTEAAAAAARPAQTTTPPGGGAPTGGGTPPGGGAPTGGGTPPGGGAPTGSGTPPGGGAPTGSGTGPDLATAQGAPYDGTAAEATQPSFATLVLSLSTQVLMCLGEIPEAPGAEPSQDLDAARNIIDLLAVLEQKTKGNLTEDEHALLERILYDLRMRFVQLSGSAR